MNLREYLRHAGDRIKATPASNPQLEAEVLIRHVLSFGREQFFAELKRRLSPDETALLDALVARRASGEPLAYLTGHREFYGLEFAVDDRVLIPRQETELLVELALKFAGGLPPSRRDDVTIVDVGTGSGAVAIALAHYLPNATVFAVELDEDAMTVARGNCQRHNLSDRVHLRSGDLLGPVQSPVDIIVSNPPYIPTDVISTLAIEVQREPRRALDGGTDGLDVTRRLLRQAPAKLNPGGLMLVELSPDQMDEAENLARDAFPTAEVTHADDLLGLARVLVVKTGEATGRAASS
ncbi:MAG: peptide chain release factor N(5)-glutamine methyltransferase [Chloroflexi bacterium]|nr:peptide chain release factor N(5)-glutamine methyltransferase [Chloroflexota bacterium]